MALSQFGGRPSAGSGSTTEGKEIGEVFLVPSTFTSTDVVEAGSTVTAATQPTLFPKLVDGASISNFVSASFPTTDSSVGYRLITGVYHQGAQCVLTQEGKVFSTTDGSTWTARGTVSTSNILPDAVMWPTSITPSSRAPVFMYSTGSRLVVINVITKFCVGCYTDDLGVTWNNFSDSTINTVLATNASATAPMQMFGGSGYAIMVDTTNKKIYRSTTGISGWSDVTGSAAIPTGASTIPPVVYVDSTAAVFWFGNICCRSTDSGVTWASATYTANASPSFVNVSFTRWNGTLYACASTGTTWTQSKSTDNGATWSAAGTAITVPNAMRGTIYVGADGNLGIHGDRFAKSVDGTNWALTAYQPHINYSAAYNTYSQGYLMVFTLPSGSGGKSVNIHLTSGSVRQSTDHGTTFVFSNPVTTATYAPTSYVDSATNESGLTVVLASPFTGISERTTLSDGSLSGTNYWTSQSYYYGSFASGFQVGQMPVADVWTGITWNKYAGLFIATCMFTDALFTSTDGITWVTTPVASLPQSVRAMAPRTFGIVTAFVPLNSTVQALTMLVGRGDGTYFIQKTAYTKAWASYGIGQTLFEYNKSYVISSSTAAPAVWSPNANLITSATSVTNPATSTPSTFGNGDTAAVHGLTYVGKSTAGIYSIRTSPDVGLQSTLVSQATYADTGVLAAIWTKTGAINAFVGDAAGGLRVRTTVDGGTTWSNNFISAIPTTEVIYAGKAFGNYVLLLGRRGTYVVDATGQTSSSTTKTLASGWVAPTGLKYVVKAK